MSLFHIRNPRFYKPEGPIFKLMLSRMTRQISGTFMHIFSAIYILQVMMRHGYGLEFAIVFVLIFYLLAFTVKWVFLFIGQFVSARYGFKNTIRLSVVPYFFYILCLFVANENIYLFLLSSVFAGVNAGLYWWGYHGYFVKKGQRDHFGSTIGEANILETIAVILTPLAGALIVFLLGFKSLFALSFIFILVSAALLGKGSSTRQKHNIKPDEVLKLLESHKMTALSYVGLGAESVVASIAWPLFLYLLYGQVISLGFAVTLSALLASLFSLAIGAKVDDGEGIGYVKSGSVLLFATWILKMIARSLGVFVIADSLSNFGRNMITLPLNALSYKKAIESQTAKAVLFYESAQLAGTFIAILITASYVFFGFNLEISFLMASASSIFPLIWSVRRSNNK